MSGIASALALLSFSPAPVSYSAACLHELRPVKPAELQIDRSGIDYQIRRSIPNMGLGFEADVDGDDKNDAVSVCRDELGRISLVVMRGGEERLYYLRTWIDLDDFLGFGVDRVDPGLYRTACGKGLGAGSAPNCGLHEPAVLDLEHFSITVFRLESGGSIFYWNGKNFEETWIGD